MPTAEDVYAASVQSLPLSERLRLATLILAELSQAAASVLDFSDSWSDEDMQDLAIHSLRHASAAYPEESDLA